MKIEIIVPVYNDGMNVRPFMEAIESEFPKMMSLMNDEKLFCSILFVDDGSSDNSWAEILDCASSSKDSLVSSRGIRLSRNFGKERALSAGLEHATGDVFVVMDSDLQHPPSSLPAMLSNILELDVDIVDGVKRDRGCESGYHKLCAVWFYYIMSKLTGMEMKGSSDYKMFSLKSLLAWREMGDKNLFFRGMSVWVGMKRSTVEFDVADRENGESKWPLRELISLATTAITAYSTVPLKIITLMGFCFVLFSVFLSIQTFFVYIGGNAVTGFSTVILILLISSGLIMLSLGIIGEYIARIYEETKGRPRYLISDKV